jgi:hypothetical protein
MAAGAGASNVNYEVVDGGEGGGGAAPPRPGVVGDGVVLVGGRAQLPSTATNNATYDGTNQYQHTGSSNTAVYDMGPESERQGQHQRRGGVVIHAPPAYAMPVKTPTARPDENNTYDMQVPGKKSAGAAGGGRGGTTAATTNARPPMIDGNNTYDMQVPGKKSKGATAAATVTQAPKKTCTRSAPTGGTCTNTALPGGGGLFCKGLACPECGAGKSSSEFGCPAHVSRPRKQSVYAGFDEGAADGPLHNTSRPRPQSVYTGFDEEGGAGGGTEA